MRAVVVGGGITGLTAAWALGRAGVPTLLLEAAERLGGKIRTERIDGLIIEHGPDSFVTYRPAALQLAAELGLAGSIIRPLEPRTVFIRTGGRLRRLPDGMGLTLPTRLRPFLSTDLFNPLDKLRMGLDLILPRDSRRGDIGVGHLLERRLGRTLVDRLAGPLIGGVYGTPIDELSIDAVVPQLRVAERVHRSLLLASLAEGRARIDAAKIAGRSPSAPGPSPFVAMAGGSGEMVDGLVRAIEALPDVEVRTGCGVAALEPHGSGARVQLSGGESVLAAAVIVTAPGPATARLLEGAAPAAGRAIRAVPHATTTVVTLAWHAEDVPESVTGHGFLVAEGEPLAISACTLSSRKWPGRAPDAALLARAFMRPGPAATADGSAPGDDAGLVELARREIRATLGVRSEPTLTRVTRFPRLMPQYTVGHLERVARVKAALAPLPAIQLAGAPWHGAGIPDCIAQGRAAADRVLVLFSGAPIVR